MEQVGNSWTIDLPDGSVKRIIPRENGQHLQIIEKYPSKVNLENNKTPEEVKKRERKKCFRKSRWISLYPAFCERGDGKDV